LRVLIGSLFSDPLQFFASVVALVVGITVHEFSHALAATRLGDPTPASQGRLSLNPLRHLDPFGTLFLIFAGFGWGKPVIFDPRYLKNPRVGQVLVGLAGPAANLILVVVFGLLLRLAANMGADPQGGLVVLFATLVLMNLVLLVFNLIPIPPLDGSKLLLAVLPDSARAFKLWLARSGPFLLFGLILLDTFSPVSVLGTIFRTLSSFTFNLFLS
jgi:Zn-dependent protease